jgi:hypothetical protein
MQGGNAAGDFWSNHIFLVQNLPVNSEGAMSLFVKMIPAGQALGFCIFAGLPDGATRQTHGNGQSDRAGTMMNWDRGMSSTSSSFTPRTQ